MTIISALPFDLQNGTVADATQVMANFDEILNDVNGNAAHNGANNDITSLFALSTPLTPAQGGSNVFAGGTSTGSANAQVVASTVPSGFALTRGNRVVFIAGFTNTSSLTLNVNGAGATAVARATPVGLLALTGGEIVSNNTVECIFDGTEFVLVTNVSTTGYGPTTSISAAATTDLGTIPSHNVQVNGAASITSFGSSASTAYPIYKLLFAGVNTLVNSGTLALIGSANITTAVGDTAEMVWSGSAWTMLSYSRKNGQPVAFSAIFIQNYISGLTLSTAGSSGTFGIASGVATDSTNAITMLLNSAYTKTTGSWAVGSGNGGLDTGAIAGSTVYHVWLIQRPDTGVVDVLFSLSATNPTLPSGYVYARRIGSMKTDGSNHWLAFTQTGNTFIWATSVVDVSSVTVSSSRVTQALTVPTGIVVNALFRASLNMSASNFSIIFTSLQETDQAPTVSTFGDLSGAGSSITTSGSFARLTNTSAQIGYRGSGGGSPAAVSIETYGWIDFRGTS